MKSNCHMSEKILFVDDDANILHSFKRNLRKRFQIDTALGGEDGLRILAERGPFAVVISDMRMPGMDGTKFLSQVFETSPDTVRILLTGQADMNDAIAVVNEGQIFRFLTKPCPTEKLVPAIEQGLRQYRLITAEKELLSKTLKGTIKLLIDILSVVNPDAFSRAKRIHKTARKIAARLKFKDQWQLDIACMLSQVGCVTVPGEILQKKFRGEKLSPSENN
ncbi:MAG TPA: response regulator, partial [Caldithrix sp.]|nr:response regulator [Caldithrix sp.]